MLSSLQNAVRAHSDRLLFRYFRFLTALFLVFSVFTVRASAQENAPLDDAVRQLAERVASIPNLHGPVRLQFVQDANFAADTGKDWQDNFRKEIEKRRLAFTDDPAANPVRVGLAETPTQIVLSAGLRVADKDEVRLVTFPRSAFHAANAPVSPVRIEKQLVYQSAERILDASSLLSTSGAGLLLLGYHNAELALLRLDGTSALNESIPLAASALQPSRDPRGELLVHAGDISILLPGKICQWNASAPADTKCRAAKFSWRGTTVLTPSCEAGGWKLLADGTDWTTPDLLQVVPQDAARKGSAALLSDFPGPILSINGEQNPASALVVTRNLRTGNYEVYKVTLACGN